LNGGKRFIELAPQSGVAGVALPQSQAAMPEREQIRCQREQVLMHRWKVQDNLHSNWR
jgi:hypothetical protein